MWLCVSLSHQVLFHCIVIIFPICLIRLWFELVVLYLPRMNSRTAWSQSSSIWLIQKAIKLLSNDANISSQQRTIFEFDLHRNVIFHRTISEDSHFLAIKFNTNFPIHISDFQKKHIQFNQIFGSDSFRFLFYICTSHLGGVMFINVCCVHTVARAARGVERMRYEYFDWFASIGGCVCACDEQ